MFILPVCIDDTPEAEALVPEQFKALHIVRLPGGEPPPEFLRRLQDLFSGTALMNRRQRDYRRRGRSIRENPWLGLFSYSEETRAYFHGRDEEGAELARRVQRKLLTVLFGQSGLGKTSLLRAGLVPRLRERGLLPGLRAHRLRAGFAVAVRADQAGDLQGHRRRRPLDAARHARSRASRCGSSCTTAATCCVTRERPHAHCRC